MIRLALAGNPNSGKTTLFNALTGSRAHVGNWPGVTVEKREGSYQKARGRVKIVDLPGIYSLSPYTPEEIVSRSFLLEELPDVVVNVVDATNLERNLYLTTQLLELDLPLVIALNMTDALAESGDAVDAEELERRLNVPVVAVSALKRTGLAELVRRAEEAAAKPRKGVSALTGAPVYPAVKDTAEALAKEGAAHPLFTAVKLVEGDAIEIGRHARAAETAAAGAKSLSLPKEFGGDCEGAVADARYKYIAANLSGCLIRGAGEAQSASDKADRVLTHRIFGIPIFLLIMFAVFHLTFSANFLGIGFAKIEVSEPNAFLENAFGLEADEDGKAELTVPSPGVFLQNLFGWGMGAIIGSVEEVVDEAGEAVLDAEGNAVLTGSGVRWLLRDSPDWVTGVLCDGLLTGLDAVLSFIPQILLLFLFLSILENSGYMARVAFIVDRAFRRFGLSGKAFMPLLMCFGCAVPGIMATRTLESDKERHMSIALSPFFSCGAKLPIWATFAAIIGAATGDLIVYGMYLIGIVVAVLAAIVLRKTALKGETPPFIMELPSYRLPQFRSTVLFLWEKLKHYLFRAATIIAGASIVIWFLSSFNWNWQYIGASEDAAVIQTSMLASIGMFLRPLFVPLGFGAGETGWMFVDSAITGLIAKEMVVATMGILGGDGAAGAMAGTAMISGMSLAAAFSYMAFNLLSVPCMAAVAAAHGEMGSKKKTGRLIAFWLITAYLASFIIFGFGNLFAWMGGAKLGALEITVMSISIALVAFTIVFNVVRRIVRKKSGRGGCCGDCASCAGCSPAKPDREEKADSPRV